MDKSDMRYMSYDTTLQQRYPRTGRVPRSKKHKQVLESLKRHKLNRDRQKTATWTSEALLACGTLADRAML